MFTSISAFFSMFTSVFSAGEKLANGASNYAAIFEAHSEEKLGSVVGDGDTALATRARLQSLGYLPPSK